MRTQIYVAAPWRFLDGLWRLRDIGSRRQQATELDAKRKARVTGKGQAGVERNIHG